METFTTRLAASLTALRNAEGWTLEQLHQHSGVSRSALSRIENAEVSPSAETLGRICAAYGLQISHLMTTVEPQFTAHISADQQEVWTDPQTGFERRLVSPPGVHLKAEVIQGSLPANQVITYESPAKPGQEHHLILLHGSLRLSVEELSYELNPGDSLRYLLNGASRFETGADPAQYLLVLL